MFSHNGAYFAPAVLPGCLTTLCLYSVCKSPCRSACLCFRIFNLRTGQSLRCLVMDQKFCRRRFSFLAFSEKPKWVHQAIEHTFLCLQLWVVAEVPAVQCNMDSAITCSWHCYVGKATWYWLNVAITPVYHRISAAVKLNDIFIFIHHIPHDVLLVCFKYRGLQRQQQLLQQVDVV